MTRTVESNMQYVTSEQCQHQILRNGFKKKHVMDCLFYSALLCLLANTNWDDSENIFLSV